MNRGERATEGLRLPRWARLWIYGAGAACLLTGGLWLLFHHFVHPQGPFGPSTHPLEPIWLALHGGAAFLLVWALGLIWMGHVRRGWTGRRNRTNGRIFTGLVLFLAISGWGLYYLGNETARDAIAIAHWGLGFLAAAWLPWHAISGRRQR